MNLALQFRDRLDQWTASELDQLVANLMASWQVEHRVTDDQHAALNVDSITFRTAVGIGAPNITGDLVPSTAGTYSLGGQQDFKGQPKNWKSVWLSKSVEFGFVAQPVSGTIVSAFSINESSATLLQINGNLASTGQQIQFNVNTQLILTVGGGATITNPISGGLTGVSQSVVASFDLVVPLVYSTGSVWAAGDVLVGGHLQVGSASTNSWKVHIAETVASDFVARIYNTNTSGHGLIVSGGSSSSTYAQQFYTANLAAYIGGFRGDKVLELNAAVVQSLGEYIYPGSSSGLSNYQTSFWLSSNATFGLYTNTSLATAAGNPIFPGADTSVTLLADSPGRLRIGGTTSSVTAYLGWDGVQFIPFNHQTKNLGHPSFSWNALYYVTLVATSDEKLKQNIRPSGLGTSFLLALQPKDYQMIADGPSGKVHHGFIAQDVQALLNQYSFGGVYDGSEAGPVAPTDPKSTTAAPTYMGINYQDLIAPIVKGFQELAARVSALEKPKAS